MASGVGLKTAVAVSLSSVQSAEAQEEGRHPLTGEFERIYNLYKNTVNHFRSHQAMCDAYGALKTFVDQNRTFEERFNQVLLPPEALTLVFNSKLRSYIAANKEFNGCGWSDDSTGSRRSLARITLGGARRELNHFLYDHPGYKRMVPKEYLKE